MKKTPQILLFYYNLFTFVMYNKEEYANTRKRVSPQLIKVGFPMDRSRTMPRLCFVLTALLTLASSALRSVCMLTQFDETVGYFNPGPLPTLSNVLYFIAVAVAIAGALLIPKGSLPVTLDTRLRLPAAFLWGASLAAFTVAALLFCYKDRTHDAILAPILVGLPASLFFFISADRSGLYPDWLSLAGFVPVLWCFCGIWETYADQYTTMNSPIKISLQMGLIGLALILVSELRFRLGKALPRGAVAFMGTGSFLALNGSVPILLGTGAHILDNTLHLFYAIVLLCGGLYGLYTLFQFTWFPSEREETEDGPESDTPDVEDDGQTRPDGPDSPNAV